MPLRLTDARLPELNSPAGSSARFALALRSTDVSAVQLRSKQGGREQPTKLLLPIARLASARMSEKAPDSKPVTPAPVKSSNVRRVRFANVVALSRPSPLPPPGVPAVDPHEYGTWQEIVSDVIWELTAGKSCDGKDVRAFSLVFHVPLKLTLCKSILVQNKHGGSSMRSLALASTNLSCVVLSKKPAGSVLRLLPPR